MVYQLPAILIGGPPHAGKSVLTYNLTQALRHLNIPHYVFRANPDIEGDWFLQANPTTVRQILLRVEDYRHWTDIFRAFVCRDLARRQLPLIVDLGGLPRDTDTCIFQVCTHSVLLLKDEDENATQTWHHFTSTNGLLPLAEIRSLWHGDSTLATQEPTITGTLAGLERGKDIHTPIFDVLVKRVSQLFGSYTPAELEQLHMDSAPIKNIVHVEKYLLALDATRSRWTTELLCRLLAELPTQSAMAVYGRGPNWLYGALALHAGTQPFYQFDARLGWVTPPMLHASTSAQLPQSIIHVNEDREDSDRYVIYIHPVHNYLDYSEAEQLVFPEPPSQCGVIVSGKLPLWLFTALARFYVQRNVPWIALNDAHDNRPVVIYSQIATHTIGEILPTLA
ncbi:MAG: CRISPR-associated protein Csx3 [Ktedonobacteraceae bacterium]